MGRNVFWGETSYLCFLTKKVGRNVFWGETSQGEMSWGEMSSGEKRPAPLLRADLPVNELKKSNDIYYGFAYLSMDRYWNDF